MLEAQLLQESKVDSTNTGGPAFPSHGSMGEVAQEGMTLRDYFAAKAMQGMIANSNLIVNGMFSEDNFEVAYKAADAMLKARAA